MKAKELRDLSEDQLERLIFDLSREIYDLKNELALSRKLEQPHLITHKRKTKARANTILCEKRIQKSR